MTRLIYTLIFAVTALSGCTGIPEGVTPVKGFQLDRYLGIWYEIARLDHGFEVGLSDVTATYQLRTDGGMDVLNKGYDAEKKSWREAKGRAYFLGSPDTASLKVSFFGPFYGGYHVMALDPKYQWAMIAGPTHKYFWILARTPSLPQATLDELLAKARQSGFNLDGLITVKQENSKAGAR
jgi:apolipoprotein D and lipocalin family protein